MNQLSKTYSNSSLDSAVYYAKQGLDLSFDIEYNLGIAENAASLGDYYIVYDSLTLAYEYYLQSVSRFEYLKMDFEYSQI